MHLQVVIVNFAKRQSGKLLCWTRVVWRSVLLFLLLCPIALGEAENSEPQKSPAQQLELADSVKTSDHARFDRILERLLPLKPSFPEDTQWYFAYLKAWDIAYHGDYGSAVRRLNMIARESPRADMRIRAGTTLMNIDAEALQYDRAFRRLVELMSEVPQIHNRRASAQLYATAAILYNKVGEYDLAISSADHLLVPGSPGSDQCKGHYFKLLAIYHKGQLRIGDPQIDLTRQICGDSGELMLSNSLRILLAKLQLSKGNSVAALALLSKHASEVQETGYAELISMFDSVLAEAYLQTGDPRHAEKYARRVITTSSEQKYSESLAHAYKVLYLVSKARGNTDAALSWYEKYAAADKGYLNEVSAKSLAYQKVKQRVQSSRAQTETAQKQNRILQLQQTLSEKVAETRGLYAALLLGVLVVLSAWVWRLLRAQRRLRTLAEHDSLTGISNRQHFVDAASGLLNSCRRAGGECSLILLDLDHFKLVNDNHGHAVGDAVLKQTVVACQEQMRSSDLFGRLGGEEFGILLPNCRLAVAVAQAERIRGAIAALSNASHETPDVSASIGVASTARASYELRQLMIHADDALYRAKRNGRDRVAVSDGTVSMVRTSFPSVG